MQMRLHRAPAPSTAQWHRIVPHEHHSIHICSNQVANRVRNYDVVWRRFAWRHPPHLCVPEASRRRHCARKDGRLLYCSTTLHSTQLEPRAKQKLQTTSQHQPCKLQAHRLEADAKCYMLTCQQCADFLILSTLNSYSYTNRGTRAVNCELRAA